MILLPRALARRPVIVIVVGVLPLSVNVATTIVVVIRGEGVFSALHIGALVRTPITRAVVTLAVVARGLSFLDLVLIGGPVIAQKLEVIVHQHACGSMEEGDERKKVGFRGQWA